MNQEQITLRSRQLNPCDHLFWKCRGYESRPDNWQDLLEEMGYYDDSDESECEEDSEEGSYNDEEGDNSEYSDEYDEDDSEEYEEHRQYSNRNNPNNDEYWIARGYRNGRPDNWREIIFGS